MKNYKILIISLLLLVFMVGAVSAADENVADDNLEISDEISVDEEAVASSDVEEVELNDILKTTEDDNIGIDQPDMSIVRSNDVVVLYGEDAKFEATFLNTEFNPMPIENPMANLNVVFEITNQSGDLIKQINAVTNDMGVASFDIDFPLGKYTVVSKNPLSETQTSTNYIYIVNEILPTLNADDVTVILGETNIYNIKVNDVMGNPLEGECVSWDIDDSGWGYTDYTDENGIVSFEIDLPVGIHTIVIEKGDDFLGNYEEITRTIVVLASPSIVDEGSADDIIAVSFTDIDGAALVGSNVTFLIGEESYTRTTDENGTVSFDLSVLPLGEYNITIVNPVTGQKVTKSVSLTTDETLLAGDVVAVYDDGAKFSATFTDKYGKPLVNSAVTFIVNGKTINATTDENGVASFINSNINAGNYTVVITNPVTGNEINRTLTINKANVVLAASDVAMIYNAPKALVITLKDANGNILAKQNVVIKLNGKTYNKVTDSNGKVSLSVNLPAKAYTATISFAGDNYLNVQKTAKIIVKKATPKMTAKKATLKNKKYTITLKDNKNKAMKKVKVTLKVKGKTYKATTNAKGKATFKLTKLTKKGKYSAKVKFAGNKNFKAVIKSVKLTVK